MRAKLLMESNPEIREALIIRFGATIYLPSGGLNKAALANIIFNDTNALAIVNAIVHPRVDEDFSKWALQYEPYAYVIKEAAILFENGGYKHLDANILVTAPVALRIARCLRRDGSSAEAVEKRIANQWDDARKITLAQYIITNDNNTPLIPQVLQIHETLNLTHTRYGKIC
jgi:dephospho-CoA kinase